MAHSSVDFLVKKVEEVELSEAFFYGDDLSFEKKVFRNIN